MKCFDCRYRRALVDGRCGRCHQRHLELVAANTDQDDEGDAD